MVMHGANIDQLRRLSLQMVDGVDSIRRLVQELNLVALANGVWSGPDAQTFRDQWCRDSRPSLNKVAQALEDAAGLLRSEATQQQEASSVNGPGAVFVPHSASRSEKFGSVSADVLREWNGMSDDEKKWVLREISDQYAIEYGILRDSFHIEFVDMEENSLGQWDESKRIMKLNTDHLDDPAIVTNTVAHEMRHAGQYEMARDAGYNLTSSGDLVTPIAPVEKWLHPGIQPSDALRWRQGLENYKGSSNFDAYWSQEVEVDARHVGKQEAERLTTDRLRDLRQRVKDGQVSDDD